MLTELVPDALSVERRPLEDSEASEVTDAVDASSRRVSVHARGLSPGSLRGLGGGDIERITGRVLTGSISSPDYFVGRVCNPEMANPPALAPVDQCESLIFDERTGLFNDSCYQRDRDRQSVESSKYGIENFRDVDACGRDILSLSTCHPNLRFRNGYGNLTACNVEDDSMVRISGPKNTNPRHRQQLATRVAHGGPNLSKGELYADAESQLLHAENSLRKRPCSVLTGATTHNFMPMLPCVQTVQAVEHVVPSWQVVDTRAWVRDADYLKRCDLHERERAILR